MHFVVSELDGARACIGQFTPAPGGEPVAGLLLACLLRGLVATVCLVLFGLRWGEAIFIGAILNVLA